MTGNNFFPLALIAILLFWTGNSQATPCWSHICDLGCSYHRTRVALLSPHYLPLSLWHNAGWSIKFYGREGGWGGQCYQTGDLLIWSTLPLSFAPLCFKQSNSSANNSNSPTCRLVAHQADECSVRLVAHQRSPIWQGCTVSLCHCQVHFALLFDIYALVAGASFCWRYSSANL